MRRKSTSSKKNNLSLSSVVVVLRLALKNTAKRKRLASIKSNRTKRDAFGQNPLFSPAFFFHLILTIFPEFCARNKFTRTYRVSSIDKISFHSGARQKIAGIEKLRSIKVLHDFVVQRGWKQMATH